MHQQVRQQLLHINRLLEQLQVPSRISPKPSPLQRLSKNLPVLKIHKSSAKLKDWYQFRSKVKQERPQLSYVREQIKSIMMQHDEQYHLSKSRQRAFSNSTIRAPNRSKQNIVVIEVSDFAKLQESRSIRSDLRRRQLDLQQRFRRQQDLLLSERRNSLQRMLQIQRDRIKR